MWYWFLYSTSTGEIYSSPYCGPATEWTNIPAGCSVLGPIAQSDPTATDAHANPSIYLVQNGALVLQSNATAYRLAQAQAQQISALNAAYQQALTAGFPSTATGSSVTYLFDPARQLELTQLGTSVSLGIAVYPLNVDASTGTASLTQTQVMQLLKDLQTFVWTQKSKLNSLIAQVNAATTVADVQAVVWS